MSNIEKIEVLLCTCLRCGHKWQTRTPEKPRICPKCKSPYWDKPKRKKERKK